MEAYLVVLVAIAGIAHSNEHGPMCSRNGTEMPGFTDSMRHEFLAMHNVYRSMLALGHIRISEEPEYYDDYSSYDSLYAPTASRMRYLEYDCEAEKSAYMSARNCSDSSSPPEGYDENKYIFENSNNISEAALKAMISWAKEAFNLNKTEKGEGVLYRSNHDISNFANLARDTREKFGCAVVNCPLGEIDATTIYNGEAYATAIHVVCHYPKIEKEENQIYKVGKPCDDCSEYKKEADNTTSADPVCRADDGVCKIGSQDVDFHGRWKYIRLFRDL
ncbi:SCP-like protein [Ancylostoma caninum]|uniref:SCP-like protein n=1 Tax=Ancylostoma caninum TaxID=29170 RepID=A0A368H1U7_ANCCA|nr:SCP-like protein [Ancylostoma caninum]